MPAVLPLLAIGGLFLCLWQGRGRLAGLGPMVFAVVLWSQTERPALLISDGGGLVGVMTEGGRALSRARGDGFVAQNWLENDGRGDTQETAAALWPGSREGRVATARIGGVEVVHLQGKRAGQDFDGCRGGRIVVSSVPIAVTGDCQVFDPERMKATGAVALWIGAEGPEWKTAAEVSGRRLWHPAPPSERMAKTGQ